MTVPHWRHWLCVPQRRDTHTKWTPAHTALSIQYRWTQYRRLHAAQTEYLQYLDMWGLHITQTGWTQYSTRTVEAACHTDMQAVGSRAESCGFQAYCWRKEVMWGGKEGTSLVTSRPSWRRVNPRCSTSLCGFSRSPWGSRHLGDTRPLEVCNIKFNNFSY
jgi:hypothetical protein